LIRLPSPSIAIPRITLENEAAGLDDLERIFRETGAGSSRRGR